MANIGCANKDVKIILRSALAQGCTVVRTKGGHWRISRSGCQSVIVANTPSDGRALKNVRADLKRHLGVIL